MYQDVCYFRTRVKVTIYDNTYNYYIYVYHYTLDFAESITV